MRAEGATVPVISMPADHGERFALANEVHARPPEALETPARVSYLAVLVDTQERERAELDIGKLAKETGRPAGKISTAVRLGAIYHEVLGEATDWGADLIVVGSHHPSFATYLIGSNAANIVRHAHCSVLVVR